MNDDYEQKKGLVTEAVTDLAGLGQRNLPAADFSSETGNLINEMTVNEIRYAVALLHTEDEQAAQEVIGVQNGNFRIFPRFSEKRAHRLVGYLKQDAVTASQHILTFHSTKAAMVNSALLDSPREHIRAGAARDILDRTLGKPVQRSVSQSEQTVHKVYHVVNPDQWPDNGDVVEGSIVDDE